MWNLWKAEKIITGYFSTSYYYVEIEDRIVINDCSWDDTEITEDDLKNKYMDDSQSSPIHIVIIDSNHFAEKLSKVLCTFTNYEIVHFTH